MNKLLIVAVSLTLSACGGSSDPCDTQTITQKVTDSTGTYYLTCRTFQCPGFPRETSCQRSG